MTTKTDLTYLHDHELREFAAKGGPAARSVLDARARASRHVRVTIARMYGREIDTWSIVPYVTDHETIGVIDIADGTAWDSGEDAGPDIDSFGRVEPTGEVYAGGSVLQGTVSFGYRQPDGSIKVEPVQHDGTAVVDGEVVPPAAPDGWRQIAIPTWRGYGPDDPRRSPVPVHEVTPDRWIRPTLAAAHLMTCYGHPGTVDGEHLMKTHGHGWQWPHGVPEWIDGPSITVIDVIAHDPRNFGEFTTSLPWTSWERGDNDIELERVRPLLDAARSSVAESLRQVRSAGELRERFREAADYLEEGGNPSDLPPELFDTLRQIANKAQNWRADSGLRDLMRAVDAHQRQSPWEAAKALSPDMVYRAWPCRDAM